MAKALECPEAAIAQVARKKPRRAIGALYMLILSRPPMPTEVAAVERYRRKARLAPRRTALPWAIMVFTSGRSLFSPHW